MKTAISFFFFLVALSFSVSAEDNLRYFMVQGKVNPEVAKRLVDTPSDPTEGAKKSIESIPGAKLVDYYLEAGTAQNIAIIAVPDSDIAAALVYQRMASGALLDIHVREIIPARKFKGVMEKAKAIK